jgi:cytidyltransferase-like protein
MLDEASTKFVSHKIKTAQEVAAAVGSRPRDKKVIMCHGTFDLVHPGHIRHLLYAASKGDVLVASLTGDEHIIKANFRPFVPQELRAFNLAALEMVNYVVIDKDATPIKNIGLIKPDYFAKGYEYTKDGLHPRTAVEKEADEAYGGELLFTPGDIVYSSSGIIETTPPALATEKLLALLQAERLDFDGLRGALTRLAGIRVHVVGDTIVDSYTHITLIGGSQARIAQKEVRPQQPDSGQEGASLPRSQHRIEELCARPCVGISAAEPHLRRRQRGVPCQGLAAYLLDR